jgi:hypothetical protein
MNDHVDDWACGYENDSDVVPSAALAFKWIRILFRCWQDRVAYDESRYLMALAKRGSHLTSAFVAASVSM